MLLSAYNVIMPKNKVMSDMTQKLKDLKRERLQIAVAMSRLDQAIAAEKDYIAELEAELAEAKRYADE